MKCLLIVIAMTMSILAQSGMIGAAICREDSIQFEVKICPKYSQIVTAKAFRVLKTATQYLLIGKNGKRVEIERSNLNWLEY
jgi:hypothetical protein